MVTFVAAARQLCRISHACVTQNRAYRPATEKNKETTKETASAGNQQPASPPTPKPHSGSPERPSQSARCGHGVGSTRAAADSTGWAPR